MPHFLSLRKDDDHPIEDGISITHKGVRFHEVDRKHGGSYSLHVVNYQVENPSKMVGEVIGKFSIDVECK